MASFSSSRTSSSRSSAPTYTPNRDFIRGNGTSETFAPVPINAAVIPFMLSDASLADASANFLRATDAYAQLISIGADDATALSLLQSGDVGRVLTSDELGFLFNLVDPAQIAAINTVIVNPVAPATSFAGLFSLYNELLNLPSPPNFDFSGVLGIEPVSTEDPILTLMEGGDTIYGRDGDDTVIDLSGNNSLVMGDGNNTIILGEGDDRVFTGDGDNTIRDFGGNNRITTGDGDDTITTGDGDDNINAFEGRNIIDAGEGDNRVRGGNEFDRIIVGTGDDFVEVRGGLLPEDVNGNEVLDSDPFEDRNFNGVLDPGDADLLVFNNLPGDPFVANNVVFDAGGEDDILSNTGGSSQGDDVALSDFNIVATPTPIPGGFAVPGYAPFTEFQSISVGAIAAQDYGDDNIDLLDGDNYIADGGGNNTVRTLNGDDQVYTSWFAAGDDDVATGGGNDTIIVGGGEDIVDGGTGTDTINLLDDIGGPATDTLLYDAADAPGIVGDPFALDVSELLVFQVFALAADTILFFAPGSDKIDVSAIEIGAADLLFFTNGNLGLPALTGLGPVDTYVFIDADGSGFNITEGDAFVTVLAGIEPTALVPDDFIFATV